jgi:superfamily II DNA or RNA helicase
MSCIVLARPTKKMGLFRQMIGRGLRPAEGKNDVVVLDHSGAVFRHGLPEDRVAWTLDPDLQATAPEHTKRQSQHETKLIECSRCSTLRVGGQPCPNCGFLPKRPAEYMAHVEGHLGLVTNGKAKAGAFDPAEWHGMLTYIAEERGYKPGWIAHKFKERFGHWPMRHVPAIEPSREVLSWVRSRQIAWRHSQQGSAP